MTLPAKSAPFQISAAPARAASPEDILCPIC